MHNFLLTRHALKRARQRTGWRQKTVHRMIDRVFQTGFDVHFSTKKMHQFLVAKQAASDGTVAKIHGEFLFIFSPTGVSQEFSFVTVYQIPRELRKGRPNGIRWIR
ncbi:MAG: hypothetical protein R3F03_06180 [Opitutaceae bacterium]